MQRNTPLNHMKTSGSILIKVKERFGTPSGSISDMRSGILKALSEVFPGMPVRICLMDFFRDLGKDLDVIGEMEVYLHVNISNHVFSAIKHIAEKYHEREVMLFANNHERTIPRTNNSME